MFRRYSGPMVVHLPCHRSHSENPLQRALDVTFGVADAFDSNQIATQEAQDALYAIYTGCRLANKSQWASEVARKSSSRLGVIEVTPQHG